MSASSQRGQPPRDPVEADDLQRVLAEPGRRPGAPAPARSASSVPSGPPGPWRTTGRRTAPPPPAYAARSRRPRSRRRRADRPTRAGGGSTRGGAEHGVAHGLHRVERSLVAEGPRQGGAGALVGGAGARVVVVAAAGGVELGEDPAQRGLAEPAQRLRGQLQPVAVAGDVALPLQLALEVAQGPQVGGRRRRQLPLEGLDVDVVEGRARDAPGRAAAPAPPGRRGRRPRRRRRRSRAAPRPCIRTCWPAARPGRSACRLSRSWASCALEVGVVHRLGHQPGQLVALLRTTASASSARRRPGAGRAGRSGRRCLCGFSGKNSPCLSMNSRELLGGVLAAGVRRQQLVEVGEHVADRLHAPPGRRRRAPPPAPASCRRTARRAPLRAASPDLLVAGAGLVASASRTPPGRARRSAVSSGSASSCVSSSRAWSPSSPASCLPLGGQRLVELGADPVEGAVQVAAALQPPGAACGPGGAARRGPAGRRGRAAAASRSASRRLRPCQHVAAELVDGRPGRRTAAPAGRDRRRQEP